MKIHKKYIGSVHKEVFMWSKYKGIIIIGFLPIKWERTVEKFVKRMKSKIDELNMKTQEDLERYLATG